MSSPVVFHLGPVPIHLFGLTIALGLIAGLYLAVGEARRKGLDADRVLDFLVWAVLAGIVGARLLYVVFARDVYFRDPLAIVRIYEGGLSWHGAVLGGILVAIWYGRRHRLPFWTVADVAAPSLALGYAIARVGCDIYGIPAGPVAAAWAVEVAGTLRHPAQLYSALSSYAIFVYLQETRHRVAFAGQVFIRYVIAYSATRFLIEFVRDGQMVFGVVSMAQVASVVVVLAAVALSRYLEGMAGRSRAAA